MSKRRRHEEIGASADVFDQSLSLSPQGTKGYESDYSHASTGAFWMVQNSRGDQPSPGLGAGEERI